MMLLNEEVRSVCGTISITTGAAEGARVGDVILISSDSFSAESDVRADELVVCIVSPAPPRKVTPTPTFGCAVRAPRALTAAAQAASSATENLLKSPENSPKDRRFVIVRSCDIPAATSIVLYAESVALLAPGARAALAAAAVRAMNGWIVALGARVALAWGGGGDRKSTRLNSSHCG